jgi:hypothetical protein
MDIGDMTSFLIKAIISFFLAIAILVVGGSIAYGVVSGILVR